MGSTEKVDRFTVTVRTLGVNLVTMTCVDCGVYATTRPTQARYKIIHHDCERWQDEHKFRDNGEQMRCDRCGFSTRPGQTRTRARVNFGAHACDRRVADNARHARTVARLETNARIVDCFHKLWHPHGTKHGYDQDSCRCPECKKAARIYERNLRRHKAEERWAGREAGLVDATGTIRRLRALAVNGWSHADIAAALGCADPSSIADYKSGQRVHSDTHYAVKELYDRVQMQPGPGRYRRRVERHAKRQGWHSCWAWDDDTIDDPKAKPNYGQKRVIVVDEIAVQLVMEGKPVKLNQRERAEVVARMTDAGKSAAQIAATLHLAKRSVGRIRSRVRAAEVA